MALLGSVQLRVTQVNLTRVHLGPNGTGRRCRFTVGDRSVEPPVKGRPNVAFVELP